VAAYITEQLDIAVAITPGNRGEFTVWVDGEVVAEKTTADFPTEDQCLAAVRDALTSS